MRAAPAPARLTEFYLWTSFGGVLGGIFAGLLAPLLFNRTSEYPILIVAALLALPGAFGGSVRDYLWRIWPALAVAALALVQPFIGALNLGQEALLPFQVALVTLGGPDAAATARSRALRGAGGGGLHRHRRLAAGAERDRDHAQLLRRASGGGH
jgi:hypothetical protein